MKVKLKLEDIIEAMEFAVWKQNIIMIPKTKKF